MKKEILDKITTLINFDSNLQSIDVNNSITTILHDDFILVVNEGKSFYTLEKVINITDVEFDSMIYIAELRTIIEELLENNVTGHLPCFVGFYETLLSFDGDNSVDNINEDRNNKGLEDINDFYNMAKIDYNGYNQNICKIAVDIIGKEMIDLNLIDHIEFDSLYSPREYNFTTDSINVIYSITEENKKNILAYVIENLKDFDDYIKDRFTSRSGFFSFYSNDFHHWINELKSWYFKNIDTQLSVILEFVLLNEKDLHEYTYAIYDYWTSNDSYDQYIINWEELIIDIDI